MVRSNRIPTPMRQALADQPDWAELSTQQLEALGVTGKYIQRVKAAGLASTEHAFTDAKRAVDLVLKRERKAAAQQQREPVLRYNPFQVIHDDDMLRDSQALRRHYERAEVRNPLGDETLPTVLKVILARRDEQGGLNATGADYLLLTLLWGTRRGEAAPLRWFDRCSPGELRQSEVSWVWLAGPDEVNPYTRRVGSQVYLFDTKNGEERYLPVAYFAEKILQRRFDERADETKLKQDLKKCWTPLDPGVHAGICWTGWKKRWRGRAARWPKPCSCSPPVRTEAPRGTTRTARASWQTCAGTRGCSICGQRWTLV